MIIYMVFSSPADRGTVSIRVCETHSEELQTLPTYERKKTAKNWVERWTFDRRVS